MKMKMFTVYDSKAEAYLPPMFLQTKGLAIRSFVEAANDQRHNFNKHAADFTLFEIGEYDDSKGQVTMYETKDNLGTAIEFIENPIVPKESNISEENIRNIKGDNITSEGIRVN